MEGKSLLCSNLNKECVDSCLLSMLQKAHNENYVSMGGGGPGILALEDRASSEIPV